MLTTLQGQLFWAGILALALFLPLRRLVFVLSVRRETRRRPNGIDDRRLGQLGRRATVTAGLVAVFFALIYVLHLAQQLAGLR